jgi:2'-5' RNA ligase
MDNFHYYEFYPDILAEGHCVMVDIPKDGKLMEYINKIPQQHVYEIVGEDYGKEKNPHVTVMYGLDSLEESKAKNILSKIPRKLVAELGIVSKFENADQPYDVLKIEVKSPHLTMIHESLKRTCKNDYKWPNYNPHVTLAYINKGTCNELVGDKTFEGTKVLFEAFLYSNGKRDENHYVNMSEYNDSKKSESSVKKELDALSSKYREHLESWISVDDKGISLGNLRALKTAPVGTGTAFMKDLISIADDYGMIITLTTGLRDRNAPEVFKKTTSTDRLKKFYSRFGFKSNYDKRSYRPDLRGNMHREPNKNNMSEYNVGTSGGYGGGAMAGGPMAPMGWAGTNSSPQTSRRLKDYPASRRYTYMQGNTVIGSSLYDTITNDDLTDKRFSTDEMFAGFRQEMQKMEFPDKDVARPIVVANLLKNPKYYSDLDMYFNSDKI